MMAEGLTTEDIKEIKSEFYGLAQLLGVDMHDPSTPYNKADVQAVREALEAARIEAQERIDSGEFDKISTRRGPRSPRTPATVESILPKILIARHDDVSNLIEDVGLYTVISEADANMTALDALNDTLENSLQTDFYNLGSILGVDMPSPDASNPNKILYGQEKVQEVSDAYSNYLLQAQAIIDTSEQKDPSATAEIVLTNSLLAAVENPTQEMANDIYRVVMQAPDSINYLMVKAGGSPEHSPINAPISQNAPTAQETVTKMVAVNANGNEVDFDPRIERLEMALAQIVPVLNEQNSFFKPSGHTNTPAPGNADGFLDAQSLASYKGAIKHLNYLSTIGKIGSDDPVDSFVPKNAEAIEKLLIGEVVKDYNKARKEVKSLKSSNAPEAEIEAAIAEKERLGIMFEKTIPQVMKDLAELHSEGALNAPVKMKTITVTQPVSTFPITPNPTATKVKTDVNAINTGAGMVTSDNDSPNNDTGNNSPDSDIDAKADAVLLSGHIDNIKKVLFALSYKIDEFDAMGLSEAIIDPITQEDMDKEGLGDNFQDLLAKAIVLTKTLSNEGKPADQQDSNPNGVYTKEVGEQLKYAVLTNPALQPVRDILEIDQMSAADAKRYFGAPPAGATPEQTKKHEAYQGEVNKKINLLNEFIVSLDAIKANGKIINEEKARQTTKMNIMLDGMSMAMDKFMPGMSGMLEKFFTNSKFGKMIAGVLSYMGINVNRLWGDKDDSAAIERAKSSIEDGFEYFYKDAYKDLGENPSVADVVAKMKENLLNDDGDSLIDKTKKAAIDKVMGVILKGQDESTIDTILTSALDEAAKAGTPDAAKEAFSSYIAEAGKLFQDGQNMTIDDLNKSLSETKEIAQSPEVKAVVGAQKPVASPASTTPAAVITGQEVDAEYIEFSENVKIGLMLNLDNTKYYQGDLRLSNGRVDDIQAGLAELNLSVITPDMVKIDGEFSDMATPNTSAMIEETLIRAQIHNFKEQNPDKDITQDDLKGFARKLTTENILLYLPMIETYMEADGASGASVKAVSKGLNELANDYYSTNLPDDPRQDYSVLDQAFLGNQISLNMLEIAPNVASVIAPKELASDSLRDRYLNYDRNGSNNLSKVPCDIPLFYTEEGSDSVFALIRIKSDGKSDSDPYNDSYKILELKDYLNDRSIDDPAILKALQDNYKWSNGNKEGIEAFIDKILCLETLAPAAPTPPPVVEQKQEVSSAFNDKASCGIKVPETFNDLCRVTGAQAAAMAEKGLDINALFEDYISITDNGASTFVILEPAAFGIKGAEIPDLIVAMRDGDNINYRAINYNSIDNMKPLSEQRTAGISDMSQIHNPVGARRVDDFLDEIDRSAGGGVRLSANSGNGFSGMHFIAPNDNGGTTLQTGLHYVYGRELFMNTRARAQYSSAYHNRYNERTSYEQVQRDLKHTGGVPNPNVKPVIVNSGQTPADKKLESKAEEKSFICRVFGACGDDATDTSDKIKQNAGDIDADASNEDIYNPNNADLLNLARPQSHSAAGRP